MAALLVYSIPGWVRKHDEEQQELSDLNRKLRLREMKPEEFPARCGKLVKDETHNSAPIPYRVVTVEVTMWDGKRENVTAEFTNIAQHGEAPNWLLEDIGSSFLSDDNDITKIEGLYPCTVKASPR